MGDKAFSISMQSAERKAREEYIRIVCAYYYKEEEEEEDWNRIRERYLEVVCMHTKTMHRNFLSLRIVMHIPVFFSLCAGESNSSRRRAVLSASN